MPTKLQIGAAVGAGTAATTTAVVVPLATGGKEEPKDKKTGQEKIVQPTEKTVSVFGSSATLEDSYKGKLLDLTKKDHLDLLVKPLEESNEWWWEKLYTEIYSPVKGEASLDNLFQSLDKAFSSDENEKALNQACHKAYQSEQKDYSFESTSFLLGNIGKFCVNLEAAKDISEPHSETYPSNFEPQNNFTNGLLSIEGNREKLVQVTEDNRLWWEWSFKKVLPTIKADKRDGPFKGVDSGYQSESAKGLNKACEEAYKKVTKDLIPEIHANKDILKNVKKFCTPGSEEVDLTPPVWVEPESKLSLTQATSEGLAKENNNHTKLASSVSQNTDWWNWAYHTRFPKDPAEKEKLPEPFPKVSFGYSGYESNTGSLSQMCQKSYKLAKDKLNEVSQYKEKTLLDLIRDFCAIKTGDETITLPN